MKQKKINLIGTVVLFLGFIFSSILYFSFGITWYSATVFIFFDLISFVEIHFLSKRNKKYKNLIKDLKKQNKTIKIEKHEKDKKYAYAAVIIAVIEIVLAVFTVKGIISYVKTNEGKFMLGFLALMFADLCLCNHVLYLKFGRIIENKQYTVIDKNDKIIQKQVTNN